MRLEIMLARISPEPSGCWRWVGNTNGKGRGRVRVNRRQHYAYRVMYELLIGEIPDGLVLDHLCRTPLCVNPTHLEPVTQAENIRRIGGNCLKGHGPLPTGKQQCPTCQREGARRRVGYRPRYSDGRGYRVKAAA